MTTGNKFIVMKKFNNKDRQEFDEFYGNLKDILRTHPKKIETVMFEGRVHNAVLREFRKSVETESEDVRKTAIDEFTNDLHAEAFSILRMNIANEPLRAKLLRDYDDEGFNAWKHIKSKFDTTDNHTRILKAKEELKRIEDDGMSAGTHAAFLTYVEDLENCNTVLVDTHYHLQA